MCLVFLEGAIFSRCSGLTTYRYDPEIKKAALQSWVSTGKSGEDFEEEFWKKYIA